jgi:hypothetical protein
MEIRPDRVIDSICSKVVVCSESGRPFRVMKAELEIYRKLNTPLPRLHQDMRYKLRMARRKSRDMSELI